MTVDEFVRVFAAQRPDAAWVRAVAQFLPALDRSQVTALLPVLTRADRGTRVQLVRVLAPHLDRAQVAELAAIVATTKGAGARLAALGCVVDRLPEAQREDAVAAAARRAVKVPAEADELIAWAAPYLSPELLAGTLRTLAAGQVPRRHYQTLRGAVAHLPPDDVLAFLPTIPEEPVRAFAVAELAPLLPPDRLGTALAVARGVGAGIDRARALAGLAPYLGASERAAAVEDALQECVRTRDPFQRRIVVGGLAPWLDRRQHDTVLDVVAGGNPHDVRLLCCCGPHLDATQLDRALDLLGDRRLDHIAGGEELLALRAYLSPAQRARAARDLVARTVRTRGGLDHPSAVALAALADDLTDAQVDAVVETAALPYESHHRAWLIAAVLPRLSVARAARALEHALGIPDPAWRIPVLGGLFPRLDDGGRSRVVAAASAVDEPALRVAAIAAYAVHLPPSAQEPHVAAALDVAEAIAEPSHRAIVLTGLAAAVASDGPLRLAFAAAQVVDDRSRRIRALAAVGGVITGTRPDPPAIPPVFPAGTST